MYTTRAKVYGNNFVASYARWTLTSSPIQSLLTSQGIEQITRQGAGAYTIISAIPFKEASGYLIPWNIPGGTYSFGEITGFNVATRSITVRQRSITYASVASGPAAADLFQMEIFLFLRTAT